MPFPRRNLTFLISSIVYVLQEVSLYMVVFLIMYHEVVLRTYHLRNRKNAHIRCFCQEVHYPYDMSPLLLIAHQKMIDINITLFSLRYDFPNPDHTYDAPNAATPYSFPTSYRSDPEISPCIFPQTRPSLLHPFLLNQTPRS